MMIAQPLRHDRLKHRRRANSQRDFLLLIASYHSTRPCGRKRKQQHSSAVTLRLHNDARSLLLCMQPAASYLPAAAFLCYFVISSFTKNYHITRY